MVNYPVSVGNEVVSMVTYAYKIKYELPLYIGSITTVWSSDA